ncbi:MAG: hypothetical protein GYA34_03725 [Chloroflexi bacterium]|nr:hypothetical protein [Chloroflexota bacterium]
MAFDNIDMDSEEELGAEEISPPEVPSNRPFFVVAGILGAITLLAVACIAAYALWYLPNQNKKEAAQLEQINAQNTQIAESLIQTQVASAYTATPIPTEEVTVVPTATSTPVVVEATKEVVAAAPTQDPRTATVAALLTQAASAQQTSAVTSVAIATATALPTTGFADEVGIPGLFGMAVVLLVVIFLARRLRMAN